MAADTTPAPDGTPPPASDQGEGIDGGSPDTTPPLDTTPASDQGEAVDTIPGSDGDPALDAPSDQGHRVATVAVSTVVAAGLPPTLATRVKGTTEAEVKADAQALVSEVEAHRRRTQDLADGWPFRPRRRV